MCKGGCFKPVFWPLNSKKVAKGGVLRLFLCTKMTKQLTKQLTKHYTKTTVFTHFREVAKTIVLVAIQHKKTAFQRSFSSAV